MRPLLFWNVMQHRPLISYQRFGTPYQSYRQESSSITSPFNTGLIGCPKTVKTSNQSTLRNIPEEQRNRVLNLSGKYRLSVLASILQRLWTGCFLGCFNLMSKMTWNGKQYLSDKIMTYIYIYIYDRLCGLVVRVSGYRYRGPGFDSRRYQIFW